MGVTTLRFREEFDLYNESIPVAINNALNTLRERPDWVTRIEISIVNRQWGRQLQIEGRIEEDEDKGE